MDYMDFFGDLHANFCIEPVSKTTFPDDCPNTPNASLIDIAHIRSVGSDSDTVVRGSLSAAIDLLEAPRKNAAPLFVSYFTPDTPYEELAGALRNSLDGFSLPHRIEPLASRGSWVANTGLKSNVILRAWQESDCAICWVDADAEILRVPKFVFDNPFDMAIVRRAGWFDNSAFIYLNKSAGVERMLILWERLCHENPNVWDQALLTTAWYQTVREMDFSTFFLADGIFRLPRPKIRDLRDAMFYYPRKKKVRPFIFQKQASRKLKSYISEAPTRVNEVGSDDFKSEFRITLQTFDFSHPLESVTDVFE